MNGRIRIKLAVAACMMIAGIAMFAWVMNEYGWDFTKLSTAEYVTQTFDVTGEISGISIDSNDADITVVPSEDGSCRVVTTGAEYEKFHVYADNGVLTVRVEDDREWYEYVGVSFGDSETTIYLPAGEYDSLNIDGYTCDVTVNEGYTFTDVEISVSTGEIILAGISADSMAIRTSTGDVTVCDTVCTDEMKIKVSTGDVIIESCDAARIYVKATTGDIEGTLLSGKVFTAETGTGDIDVPESTEGGICELHTSTGDIKIDIK